jgi:hypothetical protein
LFSYDYVHSPTGRPWPHELDFRTPLIVFAVLFGLTLVGLAWRKSLRTAVVGLCASSVLFTWFLLDVFMRDVAPFWSQKGTIAEYYKRRRSPDERLIAYSMYWRGETFYTKNEIYEGPQEERTVFDTDNADEKMEEWVKSHRGHRVFVLFERGRQEKVKRLLPPESRDSFQVLYDKNNKFSLAQADI